MKFVKSFSSIFLVISLAFSLVTFLPAIAFSQTSSLPSSENEISIVLQISNPNITVNGLTKPIDSSGTVPLIISSQTLVPVRAVAEAIGARVSWDDEQKKITVSSVNGIIEMWLNSNTYKLNGSEKTMDISPQVINSSAFIPIRVFAEAFGCTISWHDKSQTIYLYKQDAEYTVELDKFGINNNGMSPQKTSTGLNQALQYAKEKGYSKVTFPKGVYLIDETNPIVINLKNSVIDLNGSTLQINTNGLKGYSIVEFRDGAENVRLTNGTVRGDKDTHDYLTIKSSHEWGCGVTFKGGRNLQMDNVTVANVPGYGIATESGNGANRFHTLYTRDVVQGSISDNGEQVDSIISIRTSKPYDISVCGGQFEVGYTLGYQGYPFLLNKQYTSFFYDNDMKFIEKKDCFQFRKVDIPAGAKYVHFVFPQTKIVSKLGYYAWISNFKPPTNVKLTNCLIKENRSLGLAFCGGQQWVIEGNVFEGNGGNAPSYAVDFEDGWELMQDVLFKNNSFINNRNDLVVCAGDNLVFEGNEFEKVVYFWERTTNYTVKGNKFNGGSATYKIKKDGCDIRDNYYKNSGIRTASLSTLAITLNNETLVDSSVDVALGTKFVNSTFTATGKPLLKNAIMDNCSLELAGSEVFNLRLNNCKITNSRWNLHTKQYFENCQVTNSIFSTHSDTSNIHFKNSEFFNSQMLYSTWGAAAEIIFEQCKATMNANLSLVRLSAGKTSNLIFRNNTVVNSAATPVIDLYDSTYTIPNGNAVFESNSFSLTKYGYVFDGVNINKGVFNFTDSANTITGAKMLHPKYIGIPCFNIIKA